MEYNRMTEEMKQALSAFMEGSSSDLQEKMLKDYLQDADCLDDELKAVRTMLDGYDALSKVSFDTEAFAESCRRSRRQGAWMYKYCGALAIAAAIAVAAFVFSPEKQKVYGYDINGQAIMNVDQALDNMVSLNLLSELDNSTNKAESILNTLLGE